MIEKEPQVLEELLDLYVEHVDDLNKKLTLLRVISTLLAVTLAFVLIK